jgi:hypothetical protein
MNSETAALARRRLPTKLERKTTGISDMSTDIAWRSGIGNLKDPRDNEVLEVP